MAEMLRLGLARKRANAVWKSLRASLWFRPAVYSVFAVGAALAARYLTFFVPWDTVPEIEVSTIRNLLNVIASSMLAVTTFSVSIFVAAIGSTGSGSTPRAVKLVTPDEVTHNALASFIGAFIYAVVGLIAVDIGYYGRPGRFVLLVATILVLIYLIRTLILWIDHITRLGLISHTSFRSLQRARSALAAHSVEPCGGAKPQQHGDGAAIRSSKIGYISRIDYSRLDRLAETAGGLHVAVRPGDFVHTQTPLVLAQGPADEDAIRACFSVGDPDVDEDPRHALAILAETASRALSPGINDPMTAHHAINYIEAALVEYAAQERRTDVSCHRLTAAYVTDREIVEAAVQIIARDGAGAVEVAVRLREALAAIAHVRPESDLAVAAREQAARAYCFSSTALTNEQDRERLSAIPV